MGQHIKTGFHKSQGTEIRRTDWSTPILIELMNAQPENNRGCPWHPLKSLQDLFPVFKQLLGCVATTVKIVCDFGDNSLLQQMTKHTCSPRVGYCIAKGFEAGLRGEFNHLTYFRDLQPMFQVLLEEGCGQQHLFTFHAANETMAGLWHDLMLFSINLHEISNIIP